MSLSHAIFALSLGLQLLKLLPTVFNRQVERPDWIFPAFPLSFAFAIRHEGSCSVLDEGGTSKGVFECVGAKDVG